MVLDQGMQVEFETGIVLDQWRAEHVGAQVEPK